MCRLLHDTRPVARKPHGCNACLGIIPAGTRYVRQDVAEYSERWTWKAHELCDAIYTQMMREYNLDCGDPIDVDEVRQRLAELLNPILMGAA